MANISQTSSGDLTGFIAGKIFDIISDARVEKSKAQQEADKYGVDVDFTPGEFTARSARNDLIRNTLGSNFVPKTKYPDLLARGQATSDPLMGTPAHLRKLPEYQQLASEEEKKFRSNAKTVPSRNPSSSSGSSGIKSTTGDPIKVKDQKLGVFLAAVVKSLNANIASINSRIDETESNVIQAKEGIFGTIKQLEQNSDLLETKLDAIIDALREQNLNAKVSEDNVESQKREGELENEFDLSGIERIEKSDEKPNETLQLNLLDDIRESAEERDEQLSLPFVGGQEGFERGGIVSGPDSGYLAKLHGDEMIVPLDNNYTQGEPSAIDGKVAKKPNIGMQRYERGTEKKNISFNEFPQTSVMNFGMLPQTASVDGKLPDVAKMGEDLTKAMEFTLQSTGIMNMTAMTDAISNMGGLAGEAREQLNQIISPLAAHFGVSNRIATSMVRTKSAERQADERKEKTRSFSTQSEGKAWWDPLGLFTGKKGGGGGGTRIERYSNNYGGTGGPDGLARGLRGVRAGFTGMNSQGFNAMMQGQSYIPSSKPQILGHGAYSAPTLGGAQRYAGTGSSIPGVRQTPGGVVNSIVPGTAPRINFLEPQARVSPEIFNKGRDLATKLQGGAYPNSARANMLRAQITSGGAVPRTPALRGFRGRNLLTLLPTLMQFVPGPVGDHFRDANARMEADRDAVLEMGMQQFNQLIGRPQSAGVKASIVDMASQEQALSRFNKQTRQPDPIIINNQTGEDGSPDIPLSHIANMGDPGLSSLYPAPR